MGSFFDFSKKIEALMVGELWLSPLCLASHNETNNGYIMVLYQCSVKIYECYFKGASVLLVILRSAIKHKGIVFLSMCVKKERSNPSAIYYPSIQKDKRYRAHGAKCHIVQLSL